MRASNCQHIKSLRVFAGRSLALPRQTIQGESSPARTRAVLLLQTGAPGPQLFHCRLSRFSLCYAEMRLLLFASVLGLFRP
jgi:hypothetical protein